ncbi:hypothetical protein K443DRAFT_430833 [Laccaria amethystina LaAM-08-1]|uniref:Protein BCP1 n=1 Tax=Laccaria amethystina LaAM-08-1 TaxID=1095629 RepID=A0A0C9Y262_9AGAR|nr:hypothetical protein K443DRAFT_430833 [Laccaria amethystina LaAM-08-1]
MSKRRPSSSSSSSSTPSLINVSFDFFNPNPKVDYHALTRLLSQLFSRDAERLQIPSLVELILAQPRVGTTIKTGDAEEGEEGDPYAVLSVVNVNVHLQRGNGGVRAVVEYVLGKAAEAEVRGEGVGLCEELKRLLTNGQGQGQGQENERHHVGLVICERLVNMPVQVVPPMYRMLVDEIDGALRDGEPYRFSHLLFISRAYHLSEEEEALLAHPSTRRQPKSKKMRPATSQQQQQERPRDGVYSFHPEDDLISQVSSHTLTYTYTTPAPTERGKEAFGLDVRGRMMLVPLVDANGEENGTLRRLVDRMGEVYSTG